MVMLTVAQAARVYGVSQATVRSWIARGKIHRQRGGLLNMYELDEWWDRRDTRMAELASQVSAVQHSG